MTVRTYKSERSRNLVLRASAGDELPSALIAGLRDENVSGGWLRGGGVLAEVELVSFDAVLGRLGEPRRIAGPVHALSLESSIGLADGQPAIALRAVLGRESDRGLETIAGEILSARVIVFEALVTAFEDRVLARTIDTATGVSSVDSSSAPTPPTPAASPAVAPSPTTATAASSAGAAGPRPNPARPPGTAAAAWSAAASASAGPTAMPLPQRHVRPAEVDQPTPEPGDIVDHFAFGRCEVIKSDGDRLHLRIPKDGRIREIALEMLRVIPLESEGPGRQFKLERRI